jgi:hypothetical protein
MLFATPKFAIFGYVGAFRLGWHPHVYVTSGSISPDIMKIAQFARTEAVRGLDLDRVREGPDRDAVGEGQDRPALQDDRQARFPRREADDVFNYYGMAVAYTMVDTLKKAGRNLTAASVLRAATHLERDEPVPAARRPDQDRRTTTTRWTRSSSPATACALAVLREAGRCARLARTPREFGVSRKGLSPISK